MSLPRLTQPPAMRTKSYVYGVDTLNGNDVWQLFKAAATGDTAKAKSLLTRDRRLANAQFWYRFPIHLAVFAGHEEIVRLLLQQGADPGQSRATYDSWDKLLAGARLRGHTRIEALLQQAMRKRFHYDPQFDTLRDAIIARDSKKIDSILQRHPDLALASDALGNNALHWSVLARNLDFIRRFVERGTPIDALRADGQSPVLLAVNGATDYWYRDTRGRSHPTLRNAWVIAGNLLAHGAEYNLSVAAAVGDQERVAELLRDDTTLAKRLDSSRGSPLSYAAKEGHLHIVQLLLDHGADPRLPEDSAPQGRALYDACCRLHLPIAELLLANGADPNAGVDSCECCLTIGRIYQGPRAKPLEQLLLQHGATMPPYRMTVRQLKQAIVDDLPVVRHEEFLSSVLRHQNRDLLDAYLKLRASPDDFYDIACDDVCSLGLLRTLLDRGLQPNQTDWLGKTLLHHAAESGDRTKAELLLERGADINAREVEYQGTPLASVVRAWTAEANPKQQERYRQMVEFLLKNGAKTSLPDDQLWATPLAWAERCESKEMGGLMKQR